MSITAALNRLESRMVGPFRGGMVVAVAGHPTETAVFYMGGVGGVWRTVDAGSYWEPLSDGFLNRASVGALAIAQADPNIIYAGTGHGCLRASAGDGVYRSADGGRTWQHVGLRDTQHIGRIRVDPRDPDDVLVAALGHSSGPNDERGVFRSRDGGRTWQRTLSRGSRAGAIDLSVDGEGRIYCATWQVLLEPWATTSGGPGSGLFRSLDGGATWTEISRRSGLPQGILGRIGIAAAPARRGRAYAIVEAAGGGVFRTDDGGDTWVRTGEHRPLWTQPYAYNHIVTDPSDGDVVYVLAQDVWRSADAGVTFTRWATPHGDNHDLWIDPRDSRRLIAGTDGGAAVSLNGGRSWSTILNQPTAEMYQVRTDGRTPYRIYGAQQDVGTNGLPSRSPTRAINRLEVEDVGGGEAGDIAVLPDDPDVILAADHSGYLTRYDRRSGQSRAIEIWPEATGWAQDGTPPRYRFNFTLPLVASRHERGVVYAAGNHVFRSTDRGDTWRQISPDLTRNDRSKSWPPGTAIGVDTPFVRKLNYATIHALAESPRRKGVLWTGSDDGRVHVTRDRGRTWKEVTPKQLAPFTWIGTLEPSHHADGVCYLAAHRIKHGDERPLLLRSSDGGRTWRSIAGDLPSDAAARVVREDPVRKGLLFAGTETGVHVSFDDGAHWTRLGAGLPTVPVRDLAIEGDDLVIATHGRAFWIVDDISPLRGDLPRAAAARTLQVFAPRTAVRYHAVRLYRKPPLPGHNWRIEGATSVTWTEITTPHGERRDHFIDAGQNPPDGALVWFHLPAEGTVAVEVADARGRV
ncbi:MAG: glycosyl hydrolase, partial [Chloroflexi bacterium]|nr:glycosyl hydrolase [Chloroflexota bacterium]